MTRKAALLVFALISASVFATAATVDWLTHVPARERARSNPYHEHPGAIQAGRLLFSDHCTQCHGDNAQGVSKRPSLRTQRVQSEATEGDLHWLLANGFLRRGMPSWSKLPDQQLWQIVAFLKSLKAAE